MTFISWISSTIWCYRPWSSLVQVIFPCQATTWPITERSFVKPLGKLSFKKKPLLKFAIMCLDQVWEVIMNNDNTHHWKAHFFLFKSCILLTGSQATHVLVVWICWNIFQSVNCYATFMNGRFFNPQTFTNKNRTVKNLYINIHDNDNISKIRPKSIIGPVKVKKFTAWCWKWPEGPDRSN